MGDNPLLNRSSFVREQGIKSCAAIPLRYGDKPTGIIFINYVSGKHYFTPNDEATVNIFADQAATAINMVGNLYNANQQLGEANQQLEKVNQQLEKANIKLQQEKEREIFAALGEASAGLIHKMSNTIGHVPALANRVAKAIDPKEEDAMRKLNQISDGVSDALEYIGGMGKVLELKGFVKTGADLDLLINDAIRQTKELIEQSAITLEEDYVDLPVVQVNPPLIIEVFRNIIHNAIEAMPDGGHLKIKSTCDSDEVTIQFTDQGSGISEEDKKQLFTLGFSTKKEGKGIGLWFSKKAIEQHQGTISVESEKDKGTTFLIRLPIGSPAPVEYSAKEVSDV
jgi:signal transduction histidine kinase